MINHHAMSNVLQRYPAKENGGEILQYKYESGGMFTLCTITSYDTNYEIKEHGSLKQIYVNLNSKGQGSWLE